MERHERAGPRKEEGSEIIGTASARLRAGPGARLAERGPTIRKAARKPTERLLVVDETMNFELAQQRLHFPYLFRREARDVNDIVLPIG